MSAWARGNRGPNLPDRISRQERRCVGRHRAVPGDSPSNGRVSVSARMASAWLGVAGSRATSDRPNSGRYRTGKSTSGNSAFTRSSVVAGPSMYTPQLKQNGPSIRAQPHSGQNSRAVGFIVDSGSARSVATDCRRVLGHLNQLRHRTAFSVSTTVKSSVADKGSSGGCPAMPGAQSARRRSER